MKKYRTRFGTFISLTLAISVVICLFCTAKLPPLGFILMNAGIILLLAGCLWITYVIERNTLSIKAFYGLFNSHISIDNIRSVERSYNLLSSPAASGKRLLITEKDGNETLISPAQEEDFIRTLLQINPYIEVKV